MAECQCLSVSRVGTKDGVGAHMHTYINMKGNVPIHIFLTYTKAYTYNTTSGVRDNIQSHTPLHPSVCIYIYESCVKVQLRKAKCKIKG
jgi:hypothetical protein